MYALKVKNTAMLGCGSCAWSSASFYEARRSASYTAGSVRFHCSISYHQLVTELRFAPTFPMQHSLSAHSATGQSRVKAWTAGQSH